MAETKRILLITTGGSIGGIIKDIDLQKIHRDFHSILKSSIEAIESTLKKKFYIRTIELCCNDSSDITPLIWTELGNCIHRNYDDYDAFIITHGTNTLAYTASALTFSFENINKPIILTGSQVPLGYLGSDALMNLENSIRVAISLGTSRLIGVVAVFGSSIITGTKIKKTSEFDYDTFQSFTSIGLGKIGRDIHMNRTNLEKHNSYLKRYSPLAKSAIELKFQNNFDMRIASLTEFPGMSAQLLITLVEKNNIKAIILRAFGAGDASNHLEEGFQYLKKNKIPIVVTSQAPNGNSNFMVNDPGQRLASNELAIPAWDMNIESQTVKLAWLLGHKNSTYEFIKKMMASDLRGEINIGV